MVRVILAVSGIALVVGNRGEWNWPLLGLLLMAAAIALEAACNKCGEKATRRNRSYDPRLDKDWCDQCWITAWPESAPKPDPEPEDERARRLA
jgi:hypothetical protein